MGGILTTNYFCAVIEGAVRYLPLYNTKEYFESAVCFVFRVNHRTLYLPTYTSEMKDYVSRSLVVTVGGTPYYAILKQGTYYQTGLFAITAHWSASGVYQKGELYLYAAGNCFGLDYTYTIKVHNTNSSKIFFLEGTFTMTAGESKTITVDYQRDDVGYSPFYFEITCEASDDGTYTTNTYATDNDTTAWEFPEFSLLES